MARIDANAASIDTDETSLAANENEGSGQALTSREAQILRLVARGKHFAEISVAVGMDQADVKEHIKSILRKAMRSDRLGLRPGKMDLCPSEFSSEMVSPFIA